MTQRLLLPFKRGMIICGYKVAQYAKPKSQGGHGYPHYGIDISSIQGVNQKDHVIRASGEGEVLQCVYDQGTGGAQSLGWAVAVRYRGCVSHTGECRDLVVRYMHSAKLARDGAFPVGTILHAGDPIAYEGEVGTAGGPHVHFEVDTDVRDKYANYSPQVSAGHSGWVKGYDSTVNPSLWLWQSQDAQQEPYRTGWSDDWINPVDKSLPVVPDENIAELRDRISALEKDKAALMQRITALENDKAELLAKLDKARAYGQKISVL